MTETRFGLLALDSTAGPIDRSYWVVEGRLVGGAYPFCHDPDIGMEILARLQSAGVDTFIDLTSPASSDHHLKRYEEHLGRDSDWIHRPIDDFGMPTVEDMLGTLELIDDRIESGHTVYVHCWGGVGRTGTVMGCWLIRHGVAPSDAIVVLRRLRLQDRVAGNRQSPETPAQEAFVETWRQGG
jgi:hypothetical protein